MIALNAGARKFYFLNLSIAVNSMYYASTYFRNPAVLYHANRQNIKLRMRNIQ